MHFAYYCSGHGYGHATRVSALSAHLLQLTPKPSVTIISSAPSHVFSDSTKLGAQYRNINIDPVIQQPLAYRVDRKKSVQVLESFLSKREWHIEGEVQWLKTNNVTCVLSDAVFIACAAANRACLPCVLVTNFTFDSIWSYLSAQLIEAPTTLSAPPALSTLHGPALNIPTLELDPDEAIPYEVMHPLADQIARDYRNADLLLRLPGFLPFPSFSPAYPLPSTDWIEPVSQRFHPAVLAGLHKPVAEIPMYDPIPFPVGGPKKPVARRELREAPLLVRHPAPDVYSQAARERILDAVGVPKELQVETTKVVIVSFGGQVIKKPTHSRNGSRNLSVSGTPFMKPVDLPIAPPPPVHHEAALLPPPRFDTNGQPNADRTPRFGDDVPKEPVVLEMPRPVTPPEVRLEKLQVTLQNLPRIATPSHIYVPGAPPASNPSSPTVAKRPTFQAVGSLYEEEEEEPKLLPDGWIAIVCGVAKNWGEEDLPEGFYIAPRDVWMPDLTAVGDVLLGKLGYGTCAECVDACTPFVYVPRPLIVEEHGLRELMETSGVGVLLSQERYELGDWSGKIEEAHEKGKFMKAMKRKEGWSDVRKREADALAKDLVGWVGSWYEGLTEEEPAREYELGVAMDTAAVGREAAGAAGGGLGLGLGVPIAA